MITSCLQQVMGKLFVTDKDTPRSVMAVLGDFAFYAGTPDRELVLHMPQNFLIMAPQNEPWAKLIEECYPSAKRCTRYAIKKNTRFDPSNLWELLLELPDGYQLKLIDGELYDRCLEQSWSRDFVSVFASKEDYLQHGLGMVALLDGEIVAGASSYSAWREGIEIQVDTKEEYRRQGLATACCAGLILECLKRRLYPSWDAQNPISVHLAEKLGYEFSHEYPVYEVRK